MKQWNTSDDVSEVFVSIYSHQFFFFFLGKEKSYIEQRGYTKNSVLKVLYSKSLKVQPKANKRNRVHIYKHPRRRPYITYKIIFQSLDQ